MKLKGDFITNSSSTSFILGIKDPSTKSVPITITTVYEVEETDHGAVSVTTINQLDDVWRDHYFDSDEEYEQCKQIIEGGGKILLFQASDEDGENGAEVTLCHKGIEEGSVPENITIIRGEGGY
jgi:hypothetical protein